MKEEIKEVAFCRMMEVVLSSVQNSQKLYRVMGLPVTEPGNRVMVNAVLDNLRPLFMDMPNEAGMDFEPCDKGCCFVPHPNAAMLEYFGVTPQRYSELIQNPMDRLLDMLTGGVQRALASQEQSDVTDAATAPGTMTRH